MSTDLPQPAPRLTRLELHGFKSFASKTLFQFEPGITAVVGPNGSGKSNIADAIRWVLGETSYSTLRSKKTEDVIFAGGKGKSPAGMAEVAVTFNNDDHWLPSEFAEVTVTRRAFRGGQSEYLINGRKVRLKDVAQLTAGLGHSYTVVGQGLVDAALSQRAEERRGLFEHAADLAGLRLKVIEGERNLAETDANVTRLSDLLAEVEPNLRRLERAAKQARDWQGLRERQIFLQQGHYRRLLLSARAHLTKAENEAQVRAAALGSAQASLARLQAERTALESTLQRATMELETHDERLTALRDQHRQVAHQRDLVVERQGALQRRAADMHDTERGLQEQLERVTADLAGIESTHAALSAEVTAARATFAEHRRTAHDARSARGQNETAIADGQRAIRSHESAIADLRQRLALLEQRAESVTADRARDHDETTERDHRLAGFRADLESHLADDAELARDLHHHNDQLSALQERITAADADVNASAAAVVAAERAVSLAESRLEAAQRVHDAGEGLFMGPRHVMQWRNAGSLTGIRGTLADLITVDARFDTALEIALGGHLQDVVVDRWRDAEAAINRLKAERAGRVTFQPIETVRQRMGHRSVPSGLTSRSGVLGIAADLITCEDDVRPVVDSLLGRIVVVEDLGISRGLFSDLPGGWSTVTLAGEISRSGGSVTGGSQGRDSGTLSRARELRELPKKVQRLRSDAATAATARETATESLQTLQSERNAIGAARAGLIARQRERSGQRTRLEGWIRDLEAQQSAAARREADAAKTRDARQTEIDEMRERIGARSERLEAAQSDLEQVQRTSGDLRDAAEQAEFAAGDAGQALAGLEERLRGEDRHRSTLQSQLAGLRDELDARKEREARLSGEQAAQAGERERLEREVASLEATIATAETERAPRDAAVQGSATAMQHHRQEWERLQTEAMAQERTSGQAELAAERARADVAGVHQRIIDDLDYDDPDNLIPDTEDHDYSSLPDDADEIEREIGRLRERLRRFGYVSDNALEEFEAESARVAFLREQLADVEGAAGKLRAMLAELHETMRTRFEETFEQVAIEFSRAFAVLFGGGTARLVLTASEDGSPGGVDIVAQPPGKRLQGLSLLSGGERSLTAVALLFAILRVNPTPFVLLDEVDAALDEANVVRFRDELRTLAAETQAIVITHNRGTVEIADTLYGVTMGGDGVSQVLSLRLSDMPLDEDVDVRDLPAATAGVPQR